MRLSVLSVMIFSALGIGLSFVSGSLQAKEVTLCSNEWPPYYGENLSKNGFISEIIRQSFLHSDYELKIAYFPWKRTVLLAKEGETCIGLYTFGNVTAERKKVFHYSDPLPGLEFSLIVNKDSKIKVNKLDDLKGLRIGIGAGYKLTDEFEELRPSLSLVSATDEFQLVKMLIAGRVDGILTDPRVFSYLVSKENISENTAFHPIFMVHESDQYVAFSKANQDGERMTQVFNKGLKYLKKSGEFKKIVDLPLGETK